MIKSQEQYRQVIFNLAQFERAASENSIYTMHLEDLIEALREVVGIAACPKSYENWDEMLADAISALPAWLLDT